MDEYRPSRAATVIETRRASGKMKVREAARRADLSEGRWRQIAKGYQSIGRGLRAPVTAPTSTLARMALAVGLTPDEMTEAGEDRVAEEMLAVADPSIREGWEQVTTIQAGQHALWRQIEDTRRAREAAAGRLTALVDASEEELLAELYRRVDRMRRNITTFRFLHEGDPDPSALQAAADDGVTPGTPPPSATQEPQSGRPGSAQP